MKKSNIDEQRAKMRRDILFALERLLQNKTYVEIGVNEICAEGHISKPTFYRYFRSKDNIVQWMFHEALNCGVAHIGRKYNWLEGYYRTTQVFFRHRALYSDPLSPALINSLIAYCSDYLKGAFVDTIVECKGVQLTEKLIFQIEALNYAQGHISRQWGANGMSIPPETVAEYFRSIVPYDLFILLNEPSEASTKPEAKS